MVEEQSRISLKPMFVKVNKLTVNRYNSKNALKNNYDKDSALKY